MDQNNNLNGISDSEIFNIDNNILKPIIKKIKIGNIVLLFTAIINIILISALVISISISQKIFSNIFNIENISNNNRIVYIFLIIILYIFPNIVWIISTKKYIYKCLNSIDNMRNKGRVIWYVGTRAIIYNIVATLLELIKIKIAIALVLIIPNLVIAAVGILFVISCKDLEKHNIILPRRKL